MKIILAIFFIFFFQNSSVVTKAPVLDKEEAKRAFGFLNDIRQHPDKYNWSLSLGNLKINQTALRWNDTLAKVAEDRAMDMAKQNYFAHADPKGYAVNYYINKNGYRLTKAWLRNKRANNFESITAGAENGEDAIRLLILDKNVPSFGHRNHLLGIGTWNSSLAEIGIGYVNADSGSKYKSYVSVVIAKHR